MPKLVCEHCGCENITGRDRSPDHHRAFFGFLKYCFESWPDAAEFRPDSVEHLRAWALVKAKHRAPARIYEFTDELQLKFVSQFAADELTADRREGRYSWLVPFSGGIAILRPASIKWEKLSQKDFNRVSGDVLQLILEYAGIDFEAWKEMEKPDRRAA